MARHSPIPCKEVLGLHDQLESFSSFTEFEPKLATLLEQGQRLDECAEVISRVGILEPFTGAHLSPEMIGIHGPNYRESLIANGLLSRNRAILRVAERLYGSVDELGQKSICLPEAVTALALWLRRLVEERLGVGEHAGDGEEPRASPISCQDLTSLSSSQRTYDLVICSELLEHSFPLDLAFQEIQRVVKPGGRLLATFPMAFGQRCSVEQAQWNLSPDNVELTDGTDLPGDQADPPEHTSVYRIPGWDVLELARASGFSRTLIHGIASWKHGILGGDLACVLVLEAQR